MLLFFGLTCILEETNYQKASVTRINYFANNERSLTLIIHNFSAEIGNGRAGASLTVGQIKFPEAVRTSPERGTVSLPKFFFTRRANG